MRDDSHDSKAHDDLSRLLLLEHDYRDFVVKLRARAGELASELDDVLLRNDDDGTHNTNTNAKSVLVVGPDARWMTLPRAHARIDFGRYGATRRILHRLVRARIEHGGVAIAPEALIEAGWPGERMKHTAGLLRVYSAIRRLRRLGLRSILITRDDGYLLSPLVEIEHAA